MSRTLLNCITLFIQLVTVCIAFLVSISPAAAVQKDWQGNAGTGAWGGFLNWSPLGAPTTGDDVAIGQDFILGSEFETFLDADYEVAVLRLFRGSDLDTNGFRLDVTGQLIVGTSATQSPATLMVKPKAGNAGNTSVQIEELSLGTNAKLLMEGGRVTVSSPSGFGSLSLGPSAIISGYGVIRFQDSLTTLSSQLFNRGTLQTSRPALSQPTARYTLSLESSTPLLSRAQLSSDATSVVDLQQMTTLDVGTNFLSSILGTINMAAGSIYDTLDSSNDLLQLATTGEINVDAHSATLGIPSTATFRGPRLLLEGESALNIDSGTLILENRLDSLASSEINLSNDTGLLVDDIEATGLESAISGDLNLNGSGIDLTFNASTTIHDATFDWDGQEDAITTVNVGATLRVQSHDIETGPGSSFDGEIRVNGGVLEPNIPGGWTMSGELRLSSLGSVISTEQMRVSGGTVLATGVNVLNVPVVVTGGATLGADSFSDRLEFHSTATIAESTKFTGTGLLTIAETGDVTLAGGTDVTISMLNQGDLHVRDGIGDVSILSYNQSDTGTLFLQIGGAAASQYDQVQVDNTAVLDGLLDVELFNGFMPAAGDEFTILMAAILEGQFENGVELLPSLQGDLRWDIEYGNNNVVLRVLDALTADFDGDGDVDGADLTHPTLGWETRYGSDLDGSNFLEWQRQFGSDTGLLAETYAVPEPSTWIGLSSLALALTQIRRNRWFSQY